MDPNVRVRINWVDRHDGDHSLGGWCRRCGHAAPTPRQTVPDAAHAGIFPFPTPFRTMSAARTTRVPTIWALGPVHEEDP